MSTTSPKAGPGESPCRAKCRWAWSSSPRHLEPYGQNIDQQYDRYIREEPSLKVYTEGASAHARGEVQQLIR